MFCNAYSMVIVIVYYLKHIAISIARANNRRRHGSPCSVDWSNWWHRYVMFTSKHFSKGLYNYLYCGSLLLGVIELCGLYVDGLSSYSACERNNAMLKAMITNKDYKYVYYIS